MKSLPGQNIPGGSAQNAEQIVVPCRCKNRCQILISDYIIVRTNKEASIMWKSIVTGAVSAVIAGIILFLIFLPSELKDELREIDKRLSLIEVQFGKILSVQEDLVDLKKQVSIIQSEVTVASTPVELEQGECSSAKIIGLPERITTANAVTTLAWTPAHCCDSWGRATLNDETP
jgi:hypothetical protein